MYSTVLENNVTIKIEQNWDKVENPYYSLGLLQQTMMIGTANHWDLSVESQAQAS